MLNKEIQTLKDIAAKIVFGKSYNRGILEDLLSAILKEPVKIINVETEVSWIGSTTKEKVTRSDIRIETTKAFIILEFQNYEDGTYEIRLTGYVAKCIIEQLEKGVKYQDLKKVIVISISDHCTIAEDMPSFYGKSVRVLDENREISIFNTVEHYIVDLKKYRKMKHVDLNDTICQWAEFLIYEKEEKIMEISNKNEKIKEALKEYDRLMGDEETRKELERIREARQETRLALGSARYEGEQIGLQAGKEIGLQEGKKIGVHQGEKAERRKNLKNMLKKGFSDDMIAEILGITKQDLIKEKGLLNVG